jgi:hypothetical protein
MHEVDVTVVTNWFVQGTSWMTSTKLPYADLFPAAFDTTLLTWALMLGIPLAMLFLVAEKWQWTHSMVPVQSTSVNEHSHLPGLSKKQLPSIRH